MWLLGEHFREGHTDDNAAEQEKMDRKREEANNDNLPSDTPVSDISGGDGGSGLLGQDDMPSHSNNIFSCLRAAGLL